MFSFSCLFDIYAIKFHSELSQLYYLKPTFFFI